MANRREGETETYAYWGLSKPRRVTAGRCLAGTGRWRKEERLQGYGQVEVPGAAKVAGELC